MSMSGFTNGMYDSLALGLLIVFLLGGCVGLGGFLFIHWIVKHLHIYWR